MKKSIQKLSFTGFVAFMITLLSVTGCRKDLYVNGDNFAGLPSDVAQAATWYKAQLLTVASDTGFASKNHPEWNQTIVNKQKDNSSFIVPVYNKGDITRELKINKLGESTFSGTIKEFDRSSKTITKVITYSINGKFIEEGALFPNGQYQLLRSAGRESSSKTTIVMGSESAFPDNPDNPYDPGDANSGPVAYEPMSDEYSTDDFQNGYFYDASLAKERPSFADVKSHCLAPSSWDKVADLIGGDLKTLLYQPEQNNTCATRVSYALNYAGSPIPKKDYTLSGADGKNYIVSAVKMLSYLTSSYGTNANNTIVLSSTQNHSLTGNEIESAMAGKKGIYVIIAANRSKVTGFAATGHVDVLSTDGTFASGHSYWACKGGVTAAYLFILN